eukprot:XP_013985560.1 PREDICTED: uncharacterized protein LOC106564093 isoform X2 [Salmo salar]
MDEDSEDPSSPSPSCSTEPQPMVSPSLDRNRGDQEDSNHGDQKDTAQGQERVTERVPAITLQPGRDPLHQENLNNTR